MSSRKRPAAAPAATDAPARRSRGRAAAGPAAELVAAPAAAAAPLVEPVADTVTYEDAGPELPGWRIERRTPAKGRAYSVWHGPDGARATSRKAALASVARPEQRRVAIEDMTVREIVMERSVGVPMKAAALRTQRRRQPAAPGGPPPMPAFRPGMNHSERQALEDEYVAAHGLPMEMGAPADDASDTHSILSLIHI